MSVASGFRLLTGGVGSARADSRGGRDWSAFRIALSLGLQSVRRSRTAPRWRYRRDACTGFACCCRCPGRQGRADECDQRSWRALHDPRHRSARTSHRCGPCGAFDQPDPLGHACARLSAPYRCPCHDAYALHLGNALLSEGDAAGRLTEVEGNAVQLRGAALEKVGCRRCRLCHRNPQVRQEPQPLRARL